MEEETFLVRMASGVHSPELIDLASDAAITMEAAKAKNTRRAYASDLAHYTLWCKLHRVDPFPASEEMVALYLQSLFRSTEPEYRTSTMIRRLSAINEHQGWLHFPLLSLRKEPLHSVWRGILRLRGSAPTIKAPLHLEDLRRITDRMDHSLRDTRDRALLLLGFAGAFRRSELVGLTVETVEFRREGIVAFLPRSKTDPAGAGQEVAIPYGSYLDTCPVRSLRAWLDMTGISSGPLFRWIKPGSQLGDQALSGRSVANIVKKWVTKAGLSPFDFSGHSLRAGHATEAAERGVAERIIMKQTRHKSVVMIRRYIREGDLFRENSAAKLGL